MTRYFVILALRHMRRDKMYAAISIAGLTLAFTSAMLIGLYIQDELSYETWIPDFENIYRVSPNGSGGSRQPVGPSDMGLWLKQDYPQIKAIARFLNYEATLSYNNNQFKERITWADPDFFKVFQLPVIAGDLSTALQDPSSLVLTESVAKKFFGESNPIGENLVYDQQYPMKVTAVIEDLPSNTHLNSINILASSNTPFSIAAEQDRNPLTGLFGRKAWASHTYIRLAPGDSPQLIEGDLGDMLDRHLPLPESQQKNSDAYQIEVLPIANIHLSAPSGEDRAVDMRGVYTVSTIGFLIILAAIINYINLMTARGIKRTREIAIRKTLGSSKSYLLQQFMVESFIYVFFGATIALVLMDLVLAPFNSFLQRTIDSNVFLNLSFDSSLILIFIVTVILAGLYPSVVLASYSPMSLFRTGKSGNLGAVVRQSLSVIQFSILTGLLIATMAIYRQAHFGIDEALRQSNDPILTIDTPCDNALKFSLNTLSYVHNIACSFSIPQLGVGPTTGLRKANSSDDSIEVHYTSVGAGFFELFDVELAAGRLFDKELEADFSPSDNNWTYPESLVINETTARNLGYQQPQDAINQITRWQHLYRLPNVFTPPHDARIIGVVKDFQIGSVRSDFIAAVFYSSRELSRSMNMKIDGQHIPETMQSIGKIYAEHSSGDVLVSHFFEDSVEDMYRDVTRQSQLLGVYAFIAIAIASLGLIGLAAFVAEKRTKEIGIRKVCGGSRPDIISLLIWQFSKPVLLSNFIAWPIAYYYLTLWLEGFQRRIDLNLSLFFGAGCITFAIAMVTVGVHAYIVSGLKPVSALRYE